MLHLCIFLPLHNLNLTIRQAVNLIYHFINLLFNGGGVGVGVFLLGGEDLSNEGDEGLLDKMRSPFEFLNFYLLHQPLQLCLLFPFFNKIKFYSFIDLSKRKLGLISVYFPRLPLSCH